MPKRHGADFFALPIEDQQAIHALTRIKRERLADQYAPTAFNVGVNVGADPGQTVGHAHMHQIPRYFGDTEDPRGGVRWIILEKAVYWEGR